jgi:hypothetical protein
MINPNGLQMSNGVSIFVLSSDPNLASVDLTPSPTSYASPNMSLRVCAPGSLAIRFGDSPALYQKTAQHDADHATGVWTQIS